MFREKQQVKHIRQGKINFKGKKFGKGPKCQSNQKKDIISNKSNLEGRIKIKKKCKMSSKLRKNLSKLENQELIQIQNRSIISSKKQQVKFKSRWENFEGNEI